MTRDRRRPGGDTPTKPYQGREGSATSLQPCARVVAQKRTGAGESGGPPRDDVKNKPKLRGEKAVKAATCKARRIQREGPRPAGTRPAYGRLRNRAAQM